MVNVSQIARFSGSGCTKVVFHLETFLQFISSSFNLLDVSPHRFIMLYFERLF